jgi:broad specificity phosphatase PhoE
MAPPKFIYLIRHGQSQANDNWDLLKTVPDWKVPLTEYGRQQAAMAGAYIYGDLRREFPKGIDPPEVATYCSPYVRTKQTWDVVWKAIFDGIHTETGRIQDLLKKPYYVHSARTKYDPRIREQDWGNYKDTEVTKKIDAERDKFGTFFYRIPDGESGADVCDRLSSFLDTLWRDFEKKDFPRVVIIVTHGLTMRLFLMRWFHWDVEQYEALQNPKNGTVWRMSLRDNGKWGLDTQLAMKHVPSDDTAKTEEKSKG